MFGSDGKKTSKMDTIIGKDIILEGKITAKGSIRLDGTLIGDINVDGNLVIGKQGLVKGNIICKNVLVCGTIEGYVDCKEQLRLANTGKILGDIKVNSIIVDENAVFEGKCQMQNNVNKKNENKKNDNSNKGA